MNDPFEQGVFAYVSFTIFIILAAAHMSANGYDYPSNPSWILISFLRAVFIGSWVLLLLGFVIYIFCEIRKGKKLAIEKEVKRKRDAALRVIRLRKEKARAVKYRRKEKRRKKKAYLAALKRKHEIEEEERKMEEELKNRTVEDAIESAFDDFL